MRIERLEQVWIGTVQILIIIIIITMKGLR